MHIFISTQNVSEGHIWRLRAIFEICFAFNCLLVPRNNSENIYWKFSWIILRWHKVNIGQLVTRNKAELLSRGIVSTERSVKIIHSDGNSEIIRLTVKYPFVPIEFEKYNFKELQECNHVLSQFSKARQQATVNKLFKDGKILIQQKFENEKVRNKRQIAALAFGFGITTE